MHFLKRTLILTLSIFMLSISYNFANANSLTLNGSAHYYQLTRDYYLGGLYLPKASNDINYIHAASTNKKMQIIINIPNWTPRRWAQIWQNNIAINNDSLGSNPQVQQALMEFTNFPKAELKAGDEIVIDYQVNGNSRVLFNNEVVFEVPGTEFFNYMVNTWIGKLPPTREFRQAILGETNIDANNQNALLSHRPARLGLWSNWLAQEEQARQAAEAAKLAEQRRRQQEAEAERKRVAEAARRAEQARLEEERARIAAAAAAQKAQAQSKPKAQQKAVAKSKPAAPKDDNNALKTIAAEQRYYLDMLQWQLQRKVESLVSYPAWAKQFGQEGTVVIDFRLNKQGELSDIQARNEQVSDLLTNEVIRAAKNAAESTVISEHLAGDSWLLNVRYQFSLQPTAQAELAMPEAPASLKKNTAPASSKQLAENYIAEEQARIVENVVYPPAAKMLKKQDQVSATVVLNKAGTVVSIEDNKTSRHRELNQALKDAIKKSEPFPPFPLGVKEEQLSIQVEYDFKL